MNVEQYLQRIKYSGSRQANPQTLFALHRAHLMTIPFENLSIHWQQPIILDRERLFHKVIECNRGGFCYELNGLFSWLLTELGFNVTLLSAAVYRDMGLFGRPFDHLNLRVDLDQPYLVDVGFGDSFLEPLHLQADLEQREGNQCFKLQQRDEQWTYYKQTTSENGEPTWQPRYRFTLEPRAFTDFEEACHYQQTSPESTFTQKIICTRATPNGRVTLSKDRLIITEGGQRTEHTIADGEQDRLLLQYFDITRKTL